jgi:hypothetical protein
MSNFDINSLIIDQSNQQQKKLDIYNKIIEKIYNKIKIVNKRKKTNLIYEIPNYIFGFPLYDNRTCLVFIISSIRKNGFFIKYNYPNIIYISWKNIVRNNLKNVTKNLMQTNMNNFKKDQNKKIQRENKSKIDTHFKKLNNNILSDLDQLIKNDHIDNNYDNEIKKLNELSNYAKFL